MDCKAPLGAISFSRGSSPSRDRTHISSLAGRFFTTEPPGKPRAKDRTVLKIEMISYKFTPEKYRQYFVFTVWSVAIGLYLLTYKLSLRRSSPVGYLNKNPTEDSWFTERKGICPLSHHTKDHPEAILFVICL